MSGIPALDETDLSIKYLDDYPKLPANAPLGCPHIVDFSSIDVECPQDELSIPDLVATVLFKYRPAALDAFLDLKRKKVHVVRHNSLSTLDFCIQRTGRIVKIGYLNEREFGGWDELFKYRIGAKATGKWTPIYWQGADGHTINDPKHVMELAPGFAVAVSGMEVWDQQGPRVEIECFAGLLEGRKM